MLKKYRVDEVCRFEFPAHRQGQLVPLKVSLREDFSNEFSGAHRGQFRIFDIPISKGWEDRASSRLEAGGGERDWNSLCRYVVNPADMAADIAKVISEAVDYINSLPEVEEVK